MNAPERTIRPMNRTVKCLVPALLLGLALAGCATPESKVRSRLIGLGVSPPMAGCMADRMVDRRSSAPLRRLGELGGLAKHDVPATRVGEILGPEERGVGKAWVRRCE